MQNRLFFVLTLSLVLGIFSVSEVFAQEYPVKMDVEMEKNQFQYGEHIRFKINFEPMNQNSPLKISIISDERYIESREIFSKNSETSDKLMASRTYNPLSTLSDYGGDELDFVYFSILPSNIPSGKYSIIIEFGSDEIPLAKKTIDFSYNDDKNSIGQQMKSYFPTNIDIGTNVKIDESPIEFNIIKQSYNTILPCDNLSCATTVKKLYSVSSPFYLENLQIHKFTSETKAKKYAAIHKEWDGTPSNRGNTYVVWSPSDVNSDKQQCFVFGGGYSSANGPDGLLKCTNGLFVIEIQNTKQISQTLVESASAKIDSTSTSQIIEKTIEPNEPSTTEKDSGKLVAGFVDKTKDPQSYVDRYENEPSYKEWFDENYPDYTIYDAVGLEEPTKQSATTIDVEPKFEPEEILNSEATCGAGTILKDGICIVDSTKQVESEPSSKGGGCLIATATYGSEFAPQVQQLRELRDNQLLGTESGTIFMNMFNDVYYSFSPTIADYERENPVFKEAVKITLTPLISSLSILNHVDMDSEAEVLGYGMSLIVLNLAMYVGIPAIVIVKARKLREL